MTIRMCTSLTPPPSFSFHLHFVFVSLGYEEAVACLVDAMLVEALGDEADGDGGDGGLEGDPGTVRITRDHGDSSKKCAC